eukprot:TRINITY_DN2823_c0_g1_i1.p1 TRINITY_DN2823_c0_g1~~TRINITY_DN2823_c0_g1_i1.p1  ORF type:complete len:681 (+),score=238.10 TRINITY_DN2823_c0_g1_i1:25-2043(+)
MERSESLPEIPPDKRGAREAKGDLKGKAKFLSSVYDIEIEGGDAREALMRKVLPHFDGEVASKRPKHPADDKAAAWMREERKRAEERSEKKWRRKFEDWQTAFKAEVNGWPAAARRKIPEKPQEHQEQEASGGGEQKDKAAAEKVKADNAKLSAEVKLLRERAEAAEKECEQLRDEKEGFSEKIGLLSEELRKAKQLRNEEVSCRQDIERRMQELAKERDAWRNRTDLREQQLQQAMVARQSLAARLQQLGGRLRDLDDRVTSSANDLAADPGDEPDDAAAALPPVEEEPEDDIPVAPDHYEPAQEHEEEMPPAPAHDEPAKANVREEEEMPSGPAHDEPAKAQEHEEEMPAAPSLDEPAKANEREEEEEMPSGPAHDAPANEREEEEMPSAPARDEPANEREEEEMPSAPARDEPEEYEEDEEQEDDGKSVMPTDEGEASAVKPELPTKDEDDEEHYEDGEEDDEPEEASKSVMPEGTVSAEKSELTENVAPASTSLIEQEPPQDDGEEDDAYDDDDEAGDHQDEATEREDQFEEESQAVSNSVPATPAAAGAPSPDEDQFEEESQAVSNSVPATPAAGMPSPDEDSHDAADDTYGTDQDAQEATGVFAEASAPNAAPGTVQESPPDSAQGHARGAVQAAIAEHSFDEEEQEIGAEKSRTVTPATPVTPAR